MSPPRQAARPGLVALAATTALAGFCAFHWANLVEAPPVGRVVAMVAIACALGLALLAVGARASRGRRATAAAIALTVAALLGAMLAAGLELRLLAPARWDALSSGIADGLSGLGGASYPYDEGGRWPYQVLLLGLAPILVFALALCFWPARSARARAGGLALLIAACGTATVLYAPGLAVLHGLILLTLIAACLWGPALRGARLALAGGVLALAACAAVPVAAALDRERPLVDYRSWTWTGGEPSVTFDWNHRYGPLDWPREGTPLLEIRSPEAHYWRSVVLERFNGLEWTRSETTGPELEIPNLVEGSDGNIRDSWYETTEVTVRELRSGLIVSPGSPQAVVGLSGSLEGDGTMLAGEIPATGESYEVTSYAPDPSAEELAGAPEPFEPSLARFTQLELPTARAGQPGSALEGGGAVERSTQAVAVPLWGERRQGVGRVARASGYGEVYAISRELARGAATPYDFVRAVEDYLRRGFTYSEKPAGSDRPLASFLLDERTGYCQQFSGAMGLLLRMGGIPSRVVSGFSPGAPDLDEDGVFVVRDTDAHSWVEVYFSGIGWVPFDPTPSSSPASFQSESTATAATPGAIAATPGAREREPETVADPGGPAAVADEGSPVAAVVMGVLGVLLAATATLAAVRRHSFRGLRPQEMLALQAAELSRAAGAARYRSGPGVTLKQLEGRLREGGRRRAASYAARLGASRYAAQRAQAPDLDSRRAVRQDLSRSQGVRVRLRILAAIPPGAPRRG